MRDFETPQEKRARGEDEVRLINDFLEGKGPGKVTVTRGDDGLLSKLTFVPADDELP